MNWDYCTHVPMLYEACRMTDGDVVEVGVGLCSTPLLNALLTFSEKPRQLYSIDSNASWLTVMQSRLKNEKHEFVHVRDWTRDLKTLAETKPSVVFIDGGNIKNLADAYTGRFEVLQLFKDSGVIVIHDYEHMIEYNPGLKYFCFDHFKFIQIDTHTKPQTLWLSNSLEPEYLMTKRN